MDEQAYAFIYGFSREDRDDKDSDQQTGVLIIYECGGYVTVGRSKQAHTTADRGHFTPNY